jgi:hypothetical protein
MLGDLFVMPLDECNVDTGPVYFWSHEDDMRYKLSDDLRDFVRGLKPVQND